jgi:hypothetical protein
MNKDQKHKKPDFKHLDHKSGEVHQVSVNPIAMSPLEKAIAHEKAKSEKPSVPNAQPVKHV